MNLPERVRKEDERLAKERQEIARDGPDLSGPELERRL